jgi:hypothetical protein
MCALAIYLSLSRRARALSLRFGNSGRYASCLQLAQISGKHWLLNYTMCYVATLQNVMTLCTMLRQSCIMYRAHCSVVVVVFIS